MQRVRTVLMIGGMLACLLGIGVVFSPTQPAIAQNLPDRPTLTPTAVPQEEGETKSISLGRITGTVIDTRTGAPAPGMSVQVGDATVVTDANGNYDRNGLLAGNYVVSLLITADRGVAEQGTVGVSLAEGATVVQHLMFRSLAPAVEAMPTPAVVPAALPSTGSEQPGGMLVAIGLGMLLASALIRRKA
jgi:LPXTG-motif cell wall-anchored protein